MSLRYLPLAAFVFLAHAQTVDIYSEFSRVDPYGEVVAADAGLHRREILSPAVARGGFASFHVVVSVPPNDSYLLYVGLNPPDACRVDLYKEHFTRAGGAWIPDALTPVTRLPDFGAMPDPDDGVPGQNTRAYLLDVWVPPDAPVRRFRLEVQLKVAYWEVRPMEIRVMPARFPELGKGAMGALPAIEAGADASAMGAVMRYTAGQRKWTVDQPVSIRGVIRRNAIQDMALAGDLNPVALEQRVLDLISGEWSFLPRPLGAEWYLRLRDFLLNR